MQHQKHLYALVIICLGISSLFSCRKTDRKNLTENNPNIVERFLQTPANAVPQLQIIVNRFRKQNQQNGFLPGFIQRHGFAVWNKTLVSSQKAQVSPAARSSTGSVVEDWVLIPLVRENEEQVTAALACVIRADTVCSVQLLDGKEYASYRQTATGGGLSSAQLSTMLMLLDKEVFGHESFKITDTLAFGGAIEKPVLSVQIPDSVTAARTLAATFTICVTIMVPRAEGQLTGCPGNIPDCPPYVEQTTCQTYYFWEETGGSGGGSDGSGSSSGSGGSWPPNGGGSGGGNNGGGGNCNPGGGTGWVPDLGPDDGDLGVSHFNNWAVSAQDKAKINYWQNNNLDTTGLDSCRRAILRKVMTALRLGNPVGILLTKLSNAVGLPNLLDKFKIDFRVKPLVRDHASTGFDAYDPATGIFHATITLDSATVSTATDLFIANTLIHEMVHAYMLYIRHQFDNGTTTAQLNLLPYNTIFDAYIDTFRVRTVAHSPLTNLGAAFHHNYMTDRVLDFFASTLANYNNNAIADTRYYWYMAWSGLARPQVRTWNYHWPNRDINGDYIWPPANPAPSEDSTRGLKYALTLSRIDSIYRKVLENEGKGLPGALGRKPVPGRCY